MEFILNFAQALAVSVLLIGCLVTVCWVMHNYLQRGTSGRPLKVRINTHGGPCPKQYGEWIDLCTAENAVLSAGEYQMISLGISMEIPRGVLRGSRAEVQYIQTIWDHSGKQHGRD